MRTIDQVGKDRGHTSGFDYLRLVLSTAVIASHTVVVCYGRAVSDAFWIGDFRPGLMFILPSFFALSGFLVAGSLERNSLPAFLALRALRIVPALAFEIFLSALLIGPLVTTFNLKSYFYNPLFHSYFLNIIGYVHFYLPGVFGDLPFDQVNGQLWTIPYELECYIAIAALSVVGLVSRPRWLLSLLLLGVIYDFCHHLISGGWHQPDGRLLVVSFLFGTCLFLLRAEIPYNWPTFAVSLVMTFSLLSSDKTVYFAALPVSYVTVYVGLLSPKRIFPVKGGDYSYGLFLFGFPMQQLVVYAFPSLRFPIANFLLSLPLAWACAWISWHLVESKVLDRKKIVVAKLNSSISRLASRLPVSFRSREF